MSKNIEMNYKTESGYEVVYPSVMVDNIGDLQSYLEENYYNKGEVDGNTWAVGDIRPSTRTDLSDDWHLCDGSGVSSVSWPELYQIRSEDWKPFASYQESSMYNEYGPFTHLFTRDIITGMEMFAPDNLSGTQMTFKYRTASNLSWRNGTVTMAGVSLSSDVNSYDGVASYNNTFGVAVRNPRTDITYAISMTYSNGVFTANSTQLIGARSGNVFANENGIFYICHNGINVYIYKQEIGSLSVTQIVNVALPYTSYYVGEVARFLLFNNYIIAAGNIKLNSYNTVWQFQINSINLSNGNVRTLYSVNSSDSHGIDLFFIPYDNNYYFFQLSTASTTCNIGKGNATSVVKNIFSLGYMNSQSIALSGRFLTSFMSGSYCGIECYNVDGSYNITHDTNYPLTIDGFSSAGSFIQTDALYFNQSGRTIYSQPALPDIPVTGNDYYYYIKTK